mmetsp:Transcript_9396/g.19522  ORF Transcript_9396/g.19522 Transcript_9396/m.19522 type:complete len:182 (-) Transcript_9396:149-694(-)
MFAFLIMMAEYKTTKPSICHGYSPPSSSDSDERVGCLSSAEADEESDDYYPFQDSSSDEWSYESTEAPWRLFAASKEMVGRQIYVKKGPSSSGEGLGFADSSCGAGSNGEESQSQLCLVEQKCVTELSCRSVTGGSGPKNQTTENHFFDARKRPRDEDEASSQEEKGAKKQPFGRKLLKHP